MSLSVCDMQLSAIDIHPVCHLIRVVHNIHSFQTLVTFCAFTEFFTVEYSTFKSLVIRISTCMGLVL